MLGKGKGIRVSMGKGKRGGEGGPRLSEGENEVS